MLGCIPIIKKAKINELFSDLPVIEVSDWDEISHDFLNQALQAIEQKPINKEKLSNAYWKARIRESTQIR